MVPAFHTCACYLPNAMLMLMVTLCAPLTMSVTFQDLKLLRQQERRSVSHWLERVRAFSALSYRALSNALLLEFENMFLGSRNMNEKYCILFYGFLKLLNVFIYFCYIGRERA